MADEEVRIYESFSGFVSSDPDTKPTKKGKPRFFALAGQNQFDKEPDGTYTKTGTARLPIVAYDRVAEKMAAKLSKGDNFVAEGYRRPVEYERDGQTVNGHEFVVWKIGHDITRTRYSVDRSPRPRRSVEAEGVTTSHRRREPAVGAVDSRSSRQPVNAIGM